MTPWRAASSSSASGQGISSRRSMTRSSRRLMSESGFMGIDSGDVAFDDAIELGVDAGQLLVVELDGGAQLADLAVHLAEFLLQLAHVGAPLLAQCRQL